MRRDEKGCEGMHGSVRQKADRQDWNLNLRYGKSMLKKTGGSGPGNTPCPGFLS